MGRSARIRHLVVLAAAVVGSFVVSLSSVGAGGVGARGFAGEASAAAQQRQDCEPPRFNVNNGNGGSWVGFVSGVTFVAGDHHSVSFQIDAGYVVTALCVKTKDGLDISGDSTISPALPVVGPAMLTITATDAAGPSGIIHVGVTAKLVPPPPKPVIPLLKCVSPSGDGYSAHFGYTNPNSTTEEIAAGARNGFTPEPQNRDQPTSFLAGTNNDAFQVPFDGSAITWTLDGTPVTASASSPACAGGGATLRVDKSLQPDNDSGLFDLRIDGATYAAGVGDNGTTGDVAVAAAAHTVSEVAAAGTSLSDYTTTIICRDDSGNTVAMGSGTSLSVTVGSGQAIGCVISNVLNQVTPPEPGKVDLSITKVASAATAMIGDTITWTVTVTNAGPDTATNVVVIDNLPDGLEFVSGSLTVPPGVTCAGPVCTIASLAPGASGTGTFQTIATAVGAQANVVTVDSNEEDTNDADNVASDVVYVEVPPETTTVVPLVECVAQLPGGVLEAHFGYLNPDAESVVIPHGPRNEFSPDPSDRGQPDQFDPGRAVDIFQSQINGSSLTWTIGSSSATASASSPPCQGTLRIDKSLSPASDQGRFDLMIDGSVAGTGADVTNNGTTGDVAVVATPTGTNHLVQETAAAGTTLSNYQTTIVCRQGGGSGVVVASGSGTSLAVPVSAGAAVVCVIDNTRLPVPPQPPPTPSADLSITKSVSPATVSVGDTVTATVVVTNNGPDGSSGGVVVSEELPPGAIPVSATPSQGTCSVGTCQLGSIAAGAHVTITVVARVTVAGVAVDTVSVHGPEYDPNQANNVASALAHVNALTPPPPTEQPKLPVCATLALSTRTATVGKRFTLRAHVRDRKGAAIAGTPVRAHGVGIDVVRRTDRHGIAHFDLEPRHTGFLNVRAGAATACTQRVGVSSPASISVTG